MPSPVHHTQLYGSYSMRTIATGLAMRAERGYNFQLNSVQPWAAPTLQASEAAFTAAHWKPWAQLGPYFTFSGSPPARVRSCVKPQRAVGRAFAKFRRPDGPASGSPCGPGHDPGAPRTRPQSTRTDSYAHTSNALVTHLEGGASSTFSLRRCDLQPICSFGSKYYSHFRL